MQVPGIDLTVSNCGQGLEKSFGSMDRANSVSGFRSLPNLQSLQISIHLTKVLLRLSTFCRLDSFCPFRCFQDLK